jgi:hypothetical protein
MRRMQPEVSHMLTQPLSRKTIDDYARHILLDRIQLSEEDLDSFVRKFSEHGWQTVHDLHEAVLRHVPVIEMEERLSPPVSKESGQPTRFTVAEILTEVLLQETQREKSGGN